MIGNVSQDASESANTNRGVVRYRQVVGSFLLRRDTDVRPFLPGDAEPRVASALMRSRAEMFRGSFMRESPRRERNEAG